MLLHFARRPQLPGDYHLVPADPWRRISMPGGIRLLTSAATLVLVAALHCYADEPRQAFQFNEGDRVVFIGDTLIEREAEYGYIEERLTTQFPERNVTFRNIGWSADSPAGDSRASFDFDKPGKGFEKIEEQLSALQPTVLIVGYGMASSFNGESGLPAFRESFNKLLDA